MQTIRALKVASSPPLNSHRELIREQRVREEEGKAAIEVRQLEEKLKTDVERRGQVEAELTRMGESEAGVRAHRSLARWWRVSFVLVCVLTIMTALWTLSWYTTLTWERYPLAVTMVMLPLIGWDALLRSGKFQNSSRRVFCGLGLAIVLCSGLAIALLGAGRMAGVSLEEIRQATTTTDELGPARDPGSSAQVLRVKKLLAIAGMVSVILLAIAGEIASGLAIHEYHQHRTVVSTTWPFFRERGELSKRIADNLAAQEAARRRPEILRAQLTAKDLEAEAAEFVKADEEARAAAAKAEAEARAAAAAERRANSLGRVVWLVLIATLSLVVTLLVAATFVYGEGRHVEVVILDLSASTAANEFTRNVQAVEGIIERVPPETRLVVLGVTEASFSAPPLFVRTSPKNAGRFGEYLGDWRASVIRAWRQVSGGLRPTAKGSDLLGALARASSEFEESPHASKTLIVLSDMRQVGRGLNLENGRGRPALAALEERGLVARLDRVQVWMLGVHTAGTDIAQWRELKAFWTQYFQKAGATVKMFSPNRRVPTS